MRAESAAATAEVAALLRDRPGRHAHGTRFSGDVEDPHHLPHLDTFVACFFAGDDHEITHSPRLAPCEIGELNAQYRECRVGTAVGGKIGPAYLRIKQILLGGLLGSVQELLPINDLYDSAVRGPVGKIDAIAFRPSGYGPVHIARDRARRA